jgi:predicted TIM-barrel fold metal-dependent hydrolase
MNNGRWLKLRKKTDPELPVEPPIWLGDHSNGEIYHRQTERERLARKLILEKADERARYHGMERREFLASSMGMALSLSVINLVNGCSGGDSNHTPGGGSGGGSGAGPGGGAGGGPFPGGASGAASGAPGNGGSRGGSANGNGGSGNGGQAPGGGGGAGKIMDAGAGGRYIEPKDANDPHECATMLNAKEYFIFDIQTHHVNRTNPTYDSFLKFLPQASCGKGTPGCYTVQEYGRRIFLESDTTMTVLSGIPAVDGQNPLDNDEIAQSRDIVNQWAEGTQRVVNHCMVLPNYNTGAQLDGMQRVKEAHGVSAWKCYTPWGPGNGNTGWWLDSDVGLQFIERGRQLGVKLFCCHKGLPLPGFDNNYGDPKDIGKVAKMFPDVGFIVYHSAYEFGNGDEHQPFARTGPTAYAGVNSLCNALLDNGLAPNGNVYGELGTTWYNVMNDVTAAAHVLGKLLKYVGEDNIVWGTDSIWYGSPQPVIERFLAFEITPEFQQMYGYPALTTAVKAKILGLNAARAYGINVNAVRCGIQASQLARLKLELDGEFGERRWALQQPMLRTRRDFLQHVGLHKALGRPG